MEREELNKLLDLAISQVEWDTSMEITVALEKAREIVDEYYKLDKALDKVCDRLEMYCVEGIIQKMDLPYDLINVIPTKEQWKEWLLKDE